MDREFWLQRWQERRIGFHTGEPNPLLIRNFPRLKLPEDSRVFVPLCGKTVDINWLLMNACRVVGVELAEQAVRELFDELNLKPEISTVADLHKYSAADIDIFTGDIFHLTPDMLGSVDAIYDRAALVALPDGMRARYAQHLVHITGNAPQLLITFEYDQNRQQGPPFSVSAGQVREFYASQYTIELCESLEVPGGLKGVCPAKEFVWRLARK
ncbi:MAG: thiopurine S-methyltransferase [Leptospiraceae bacterium]|nr:thiopurine S-methyltransferase [Leptospiraceae bacterium]MCB1317038.1 thiopurine S-methyltransferase [Leptospiraceae bacterium]